MREAPRPVAGPIIDIREVTKSYSTGKREFTALEGIAFSIAEGQFVSLVGPSGCGKSTLLQIVGGLVASTAGEVVVRGTPVAGPRPGEIAIVFQDATLLPWKSALENVMFPLEAQGIAKAERRRRGAAMLELVGLADFAAKYPHQLSGGMKQRVSIARGLAQDPKIILMDEPFGALDEQTRLKMGQELLRIWDRTRKTILFITHSLTEALYLSDVVVVMSGRPGRIVDEFSVPLPRPRSYDMIGSQAFGEARNRLWRKLTLAEEGLGDTVLAL